jgi:DNA polymerase III epsilon subunit-like protein
MNKIKLICLFVYIEYLNGKQFKLKSVINKMKICVFDTETTGLPKTKILNDESLALWPHCVQFSYIIYDTELNKIIKIIDFVIKVPENINISDEASNIHGITNFISQTSQYKIEDALIYFSNDYLNYGIDLIVGHNLDFDINMLKVELMREIGQIIDTPNRRQFSQLLDSLNSMKPESPESPNLYCTMQKTISLCNLKMKTKYGKEYIKFPKLNELHMKLFNSSPKNLHNSLNDVLICLRCYYMLEHKLDIIEIDSEIKSLLIDLI